MGQAAAAAAGQQSARGRNEVLEHAKYRIVDRAMEQIGLDVIGTILEPGAPSPPGSGSTFKCETTSTPVSALPLPTPPEQTMTRCGLDLLGPLSETHKGRRYIAILTDSVTGWAEAVAITEATTEIVGAFLAEVVGRHGAVEELLARPSQEEFCVRLGERLCALMGLNVRVSTVVGAPSSWHNSLLCEALIRVSSSHRYTWDLFLSPALLSYRTFPQIARPACPFTLLYGRPPRLPGLTPSLPPTDAQDEVAALTNHMTEYIKSLAAPPHQISASINQAGGCLSPSFPSPNTPSSGPLPPAPPQSTSPTSQTIANSTLSTTHTTPVYTIPGTTGLSTHTMCAQPPPPPQPPPPHPVSPHSTATTSGQIIIPTSATTLPVHTTTDANTGHIVMIHTDGKAYSDSFYVICPQ